MANTQPAAVAARANDAIADVCPATPTAAFPYTIPRPQRAIAWSSLADADMALEMVVPHSSPTQRWSWLRALAKLPNDTEGAFYDSTYNGVPDGLAIVQPNVREFVVAKTLANQVRRQAFGRRQPMYGCPRPLCWTDPGVPNYSFPYPPQTVFAAKYL